MYVCMYVCMCVCDVCEYIFIYDLSRVLYDRGFQWHSSGMCRECMRSRRIFSFHRQIDTEIRVICTKNILSFISPLSLFLTLFTTFFLHVFTFFFFIRFYVFLLLSFFYFIFPSYYYIFLILSTESRSSV